MLLCFWLLDGHFLLSLLLLSFCTELLQLQLINLSSSLSHLRIHQSYFFVLCILRGLILSLEQQYFAKLYNRKQLCCQVKRSWLHGWPRERGDWALQYLPSCKKDSNSSSHQRSCSFRLLWGWPIKFIFQRLFEACYFLLQAPISACMVKGKMSAIYILWSCL